MRHIPVLLHEVIEGLNIHAHKADNFVYIDCNLGDGGHTEAVIEALEGNVTVLAFDLDQDAIDRATKNIKEVVDKKKIKFNFENLNLIRKNFRTLSKTLSDLSAGNGANGKVFNVEGCADAILFDLGISSYELEESGRGFSFQKEEPLSMVFGKKRPENSNVIVKNKEEGQEDKEGENFDHEFDAYDIVNNWKEEDIANVIFAYGEDKFARRIAKKIVEKREIEEIKTTSQLAAVVKSAYPGKAQFGKLHPATRTFQALRIAVNDELRAIEQALPQALKALKPGGRLGVISFHSLEDRISKHFFKEMAEQGSIEILTKKPIVPSEEEIKSNPRSRSSKLRIMKKM